MEMLSGAEMVVRALEDEGIEHIFGYPGGSVLDIYDALFENSKIEHILVRHEQAAVHMADGYARATGKWVPYWSHQVLAQPTVSRALLLPTWTPSPWLSCQVRCRRV